MALPSNVGKGVVEVDLGDFGGGDIEGTVVYVATPKYLLNITAEPRPKILLPKVVTATLNAGYASTELIATDDLDNNPHDWTYVAQFKLLGGAALDPIPFELPEGSTVNLATVAGVAKSNGVTIIRGEGVPDSADALDGQVVTWDEATGRAVWENPTGGGTGGAVSSVNGETGAVVLDAADVGARPAGDVPWAEVSGAPATFPPSTHQHPVGDVTGLQGALDGKAPSSHTHSIANVTGLQAAIDGKAATAHTHTADQISDSSATGRSILAAVDAAAARSAIGAGTSSLALGTTASTAKAGNWTPAAGDIPNLSATKLTSGTVNVERAPAGTTLTIIYAGSWAARPTARTDVVVIWFDPTGSAPAPVGAVEGVDLLLSPTA